MNTAVVQMRSRALGRHVSYSAILPDAAEAGPGPYRILYQLHGLSDDHSAWISRSNLARHVAKLPLVVVLPDGGVSFWMNLSPRERYEDFLMHDLPQHLANTFNVVTDVAAIGGLSMGGFGSLRLAMRYPERFASVWAHSAAVWTRAELEERRGWISLADLPDSDIYALASEACGKKLPVISFDCGTEDQLIAQNRRFHRHLTALGIRHTYHEHAGAHTWDYWDNHVKEGLAQHVQVLGSRSENI